MTANEAAHRRLRQELEAKGFSVWEGIGEDSAANWPAEPSLLVLGIGKKEAREIGRRYGQLAIVVGHRGFGAQLVPTGLAPNRHRHKTQQGRVGATH